ncbi:MAG: M20/M25/M40 family metallo-hydrolase, partial [Actinomycetia bacterium]|nr:M20/M25/M40 family metallo-hydrolase [Actinomycetes bacterium]
DDGRATGPGVFDMKAGVVIGLHVAAALGANPPVSLLVTGDEEIGSDVSRALIERTARQCQTCIVLEGAGPDGAVKSARRGWSVYKLEFHGVAAHAGLEPDNGINVLPVLADAIAGVGAINAASSDVTMHPTTARAGVTRNTIPDHGELTVDVRCATTEQQRQVDDGMRQLVDRLTGDVRVDLHGGADRPPMQPGASEQLVDRLRRSQRRHGHPETDDVSVGGISDANLTAALGVPTLDGLGAVGGGAHAEHEWINLARTRARVPMLADFVQDLLDNPLTRTK